MVAGKVDEATLKTELEARFGKWKAGKTARAPVAAPVAPLRTRIVFQEQPGAVQSVIRVGTLAPARNAPSTGRSRWPRTSSAACSGRA